MFLLFVGMCCLAYIFFKIEKKFFISLIVLILLILINICFMLISLYILIELVARTNFSFAFSISNLFFIVAVWIFLSGLVLFFILRFFCEKFRVSNEVFVIMEYFIQWSLIYIALYQLIFDSLFKNSAIKEFISSERDNYSTFFLLLLSSFISVWIAIVLYKSQNKPKS